MRGARHTRISLTRMAVLVAATAPLGLVPAAAAAQATLSCPAMAQGDRQFVAELTIDVGPTTALGAYSGALTYDPGVVTVASVAGGNTTEFSGTPATNTPTPGMTNIAAFQSSSLDSPKGVVSVALISFHVVATASTTASIGLVVDHLYDTDAMPITPATGTGCAVSVTGQTPTTTSTTSVTPTTTTGPAATTSTVTTTTTSALATTTVTAPPTSTTLGTILPLSSCPDARAAAAVQAAVDSDCNCRGAKAHGAYVRCAVGVAKAALKAGRLPTTCKRAVKACAARSTCGRPGFVTCCRTHARGATKCSIERSAAACKPPQGGRACVGQRPSCCDACTSSGCAAPGGSSDRSPPSSRPSRP